MRKLLHPDQIDYNAKEMDHPKEMGIGPFFTLMSLIK